MDVHVKEFYRQFSEQCPQGKFHKVIALHEAPDFEWSVLHLQFPTLCKGWYELTLLTTSDRIEFTRDYWLSKLPYRAGLDEFIIHFFDSIDDIGIYIYQEKFDDPFQVDIVYNLKNNNGFFRGGSPSSEFDIENLKASFPNCIFPVDYLSFLQIHNGFCKTTDCTGLIKAEAVLQSYLKFQTFFTGKNDTLVTTKGTAVNPKKLIPFYESFGMPFYQCFWSEWYPEQEMGNVYFSGNASSISDVFTEEIGPDSMTFPTFLDWLMFYLERVE